MIPLINEGFIPIFIDETMINVDSQMIYSWIPKGESTNIQTNSNVRNITIVGAISPYGIVAYKLVKGYVDQYTFLGFFSELLKGTFKEEYYKK